LDDDDDDEDASEEEGRSKKKRRGGKPVVTGAKRRRSAPQASTATDPASDVLSGSRVQKLRPAELENHPFSGDRAVALDKAPLASVSWRDNSLDGCSLLFPLRCQLTGRIFHSGATLKPTSRGSVTIDITPGTFVLVPLHIARLAEPRDANDGNAHLPRADRCCPWHPPSSGSALDEVVPVNDPIDACLNNHGLGLSRCDASVPDPFPAAAFASGIDIVVSDNKLVDATPEGVQAELCLTGRDADRKALQGTYALSLESYRFDEDGSAAKGLSRADGVQHDGLDGVIMQVVALWDEDGKSVFHGIHYRRSIETAVQVSTLLKGTKVAST
jgi:hypothetical protein